MPWRKELGQLREVHEALRRRGGTLLAISATDWEETRKLAEDLDSPFPLLSDDGARVIRIYGLLHPGGGPGGEDIAIPAHVLLDRKGRIVWRHVARKIQDRPDPAEDLRAINGLPGS